MKSIPPGLTKIGRSQDHKINGSMQRFDFLLLVPVLIYMSLALSQLRLPGLAYDEAFFGPAALGRTQDFLSLTAIEPVDSAARYSPLAFSTFALSFGDISVPIMLMPYWGALKAWLVAPWFAWWGASVELLRLTAIGIGTLSLVCFLGVLRHCFSPLIALLAGLFVATDPSYLFYTRHDFGGAGLSLLFMLAPLVCLVWWQTTERLGYWAAAFGLCGLGLYHRLDFMAFLVALGGCGVWCLRPLLRQWLGWKTLSIAGLAFALGVSPFLLFVWQRPVIAASPLLLATPAADASELIGVARLKGYVLATVLNGTALYDFFSADSGISVGRVVTPDGDKRVGVFSPEQPLRLASLVSGTLTPYVLILIVCHIGFVSRGSVSHVSACAPAVRTLGVFVCLFVACLFLVRGALRGHHFVVLVPAVGTLLATAGQHIFQSLRHSWARVGILAVGIACLGANLGVDYRYHQLLSATGGRGIWSDAIYDLTAYLQQVCPTRRCLLGDWGMGTQVLTLASGQLAIEEMFWPYLSSAARTPEQQQLQEQQLLQLMQPNASHSSNPLVPTHPPLFVFYTDRYVNFSRPKQLLYDTANTAGLEVTVERVFTQRDGTAVIEVVSLQTGQGSASSAGPVLNERREKTDDTKKL